MTLKYGSVCSGIEAASCAWHPLGWKAQWLSEIEPFPSAVLAHHYPTVPNLGDMTKFKDWPDATLDLLVGGTPCQSFSLAGLRKGLADPRGNLMLTYLAIAARFSPRWLVWENVPGVLSSNGGRDFGALLGGLAELGYGFAYRVLDAQYVRVESHSRAVPQRRRRVFVVGHLGDWRRAAAVLFERESMLGNPAPRREAGQGIAPTLSARTKSGSGLGTDFDCDGGLIYQAFGGNNTSGPIEVATAVNACASASASGRMDFESETFITHSFSIQAGALRENPDSGPDGIGVQANIAYTLEARAEVQAVAFAENSRSELRLEGGDGSRTGALSTGGGKPGQGVPMVAIADTLTSHWHQSNGASAGNNVGMINPIFHGSAVRRLTPRECERLQGFPDDYTAIIARKKAAADGPRYKALGNSMAVPVMHWIGSRIHLAEEALNA